MMVDIQPDSQPDATVLTTPPSTSQEVIQQQASAQDYAVLKYAVIGLILIAMTSIIGSLYLINETKEIQADLTAIIALGGVAVGGLSTMLVRPPLVQPTAVKKED